MKKLVLLPGLDGTGLLFQPLLEALGDTIPVQVIRYPHDQHLSVPELAKRVHQQIVFDSETVLLAESFSGLIAIELLRQEIPLNSIIFCASFASTPRPCLLKLAEIMPLATLFRVPVPSLLLKLMGQKAKVIRLIQQVQKEVPAELLAYRLRLIAAAKPGLPEKHWNIPCHYLQATEDWAVPKRCAETLQQYFASVDITRIGPSGHFLLQSQPTACAAIIRQISTNYSGSVALVR